MRCGGLRAVVAVAVAVAVVAPCGVAGDSPWAMYKPGGATGCAHDDTEWAFFVRTGEVNKLMVYFEGGGACWDKGTCGIPSCTVDFDANSKQRELEGKGGLFSMDKTKNVFADWTIVFVPYCTCDAHTGNKTVQYSSRDTIHHRGKINALAMLDWVVANVKNPEATLTTGCSAGSLGSYTWAPYVMRSFPNSRNHHSGDSYMPCFGKNGWEGGVANWDMANAFAPFIPGLNANATSTWTKNVGSYIVYTTALFFPNSTFSAYTHDHDATQISYYRLAGAGAGLWTEDMRANVDLIHERTNNVGTFISKGDDHCMTDNDGYYEVEAQGIKLSEWFEALVTDSGFNTNVDCKPHCL